MKEIVNIYKMNFATQLCLLVFAVKYIYGYNTMPSFVKACSRSDPNFNACGLKNGQDAVKYIVEGDKTYHIPSLKPFRLDYISLESTESMKLFANDVKVEGFEETDIRNFTWDFDKQIVHIHLYIPTVNLIGTYNMNGRILIMNIKGTGPMNNSFYANDVYVDAYYSMKTNRKKNYQYIYLDKVDVRVKILDGVKLRFGNILNNTQLSNQMNAFLNDNWLALLDDFTPSFSRIYSTIITAVINPISAKIPYENVINP